jgi:hypothetical protein
MAGLVGLAAALPGANLLLVATLLAAALIVAVVLWLEPGLILGVLLLNIWLVAGRADPGDLLQKYTFVRWLSYLIIPAFAALVAARALLRGRWRLTGLEPWLAALVLLTIFSGLANHSSPMDVVLSLAIYLRYPLLALALFNLDLRPAAYWRFLRALALLAVALSAEAILNNLLLGRGGDGTFLSTGTTFGHVSAGLLLTYATCVVCAHGLSTRWRWYHWAFLLLVAITAAIATIRALFFLVPLLPLGIWLVRRRLVGRRWLPLLAVAGLAAVVIWALRLGPDLAAPASLFDLPALIQPRLESVQDVWQVLATTHREWLGFGPRSFSPGSLGAVGEMYALELRRHGDYWLANFAMSELTSGFSELGLIGFGVYWLMLAGLLAMALRFRGQFLRQVTDPARRRRVAVLTLAFAGMWLHFAFLGLLYYDVWRLDATSFIFWVTAAAIWVERRDWRRQTSAAAAAQAGL